MRSAYTDYIYENKQGIPVRHYHRYKPAEHCPLCKRGIPEDDPPEPRFLMRMGDPRREHEVV